MSNEMKRCPFCGAAGARAVFTTPDIRVRCGNCGALGGGWATESLAVEAWNRRIPDGFNPGAWVDYGNHLRNCLEIARTVGIADPELVPYEEFKPLLLSTVRSTVAERDRLARSLHPVESQLATVTADRDRLSARVAELEEKLRAAGELWPRPTHEAPLPALGVWVLGWVEPWGAWVRVRRVESGRYEFFETNGFERFDCWGEVPYWMPLPEPPAGAEDTNG